MEKSWRSDNPEKRREQKKREKARKFLRDNGILPPVGTTLNEEQERINHQISENDFSYVDELKNSKKTTKRRVKSKIKSVESSEPTSDEIFLWHVAKENAKKENMVFEISPNDIKIPNKCPYLNIELTTNFSDFEKPNYYTIDLFDKKRGYIGGNVQIVSKLSSEIKNQIPEEYLIVFAKNIVKIYKNSKK
jgi:hypothetical protein